MYYSDEIVNEVCRKNNIINVVSEYTKLTKSGNYFVGICPFHEETTPSFYVNYKTKKYYCYGCGAGGNVINFVMKAKNYSFCEAISYLASRVGIALPPKTELKNHDELSEKRNTILNINRDAAKFYFKQLREKDGTTGMDYFNNRKLTSATLTKFGLGYSPAFGSSLYDYLIKNGYSNEDISISGLVSYGKVYKNGKYVEDYYDKFWNRVMYPIMNIDNQVIGFGGRVLDDSKPKYLNSPETIAFNKSNNLYGMNLARYTSLSYFICCEGYMDTIAMHQAGFSNAVASLGTALTKQQCKILSQHTNKVLLAYDSDGPGVNAALRAIELFNEIGVETRIIRMEPYKDPDEFIKALGKKAFEERIANAENSLKFKIRVLKSENAENLSVFYDEAADLLLKKL